MVPYYKDVQIHNAASTYLTDETVNCNEQFRGSFG